MSVDHTGADVKAAVIRQFGDDTGAQLLDADFIRWINEVQLEIFRGTESNQQVHSQPSAVGTSVYVLPTDFYKTISVTYDGTALQKTSRRMLDLVSPTRPVGANKATPQYFWVEDFNLNFWPIPDAAALNIVVLYQARPPLIDALADPLWVPDAFWNTLLTMILARAKQLDGDMTGYQQLMSEGMARIREDSHDAKDPYDDYYPFITSIPE